MAAAKVTTSPEMKNLHHLPEDIILNILARISISQYDSLSLVSKRFYSLLSSPQIYKARALVGNQEPRLYVSLNLPGDSHHRWFTLTEPDEVKKGKLCLKPVKLSAPYEPPRSDSTYVAVRSEIYQIGGTSDNKPSKEVRVLDCRSHTWRSAPNMLVARERASSCYLDEKIYVVGGCGKTDESMMIISWVNIPAPNMEQASSDSVNWGEVFDLKTQTWKPLPIPPCDENLVDSRLKVLVLGEKVHLHSETDKYVYDPKDGSWVREVRPLPAVIPNNPCCVIKDVMFEGHTRCVWFKSVPGMYFPPGMYLPGKWFPVDGLDGLYKIRGSNTETLQLANYGGKLVIIWHDNARDQSGRRNRHQVKTIWCAVIRLRFQGTEILGEVEKCNAVAKVPNSDMFLTSLSVMM